MVASGKGNVKASMKGKMPLKPALKQSTVAAGATATKPAKRAEAQRKQPRVASPVASTSSAIEEDSDESVDEDHQDEDEDDDDEEMEEAGEEELLDGDVSESDEEEDDDDDDEDDDEAIRELGQKPKGVKKTKNPSLKPTSAEDFGQQLKHLLSLPSTFAAPRPKVAVPTDRQLKLERQARRLIRDTKAAKLARGHVKDVIGGWGPRPALAFSQWDNRAARNFANAQSNSASEQAIADETSAEREKRLKKLAQRGVVRLFNAIAAAQGVAKDEEGGDKGVDRGAKRRKVAASETASQADSTAAGAADGQPQRLRRPNVLGGKGRNEAIANLSKASFLDLIRAGTQ